MPTLGTPYSEGPNLPTYGTFGTTKPKVISINVKEHDANDATDVDSGMSSEENEDSLKISSQNNVSKNLSFKDDVISYLSIKDNLSGNLSCKDNVSRSLSSTDIANRNLSSKDYVSSVDKQEVITKCLIIEPQENVIPCCSNDANSINPDKDRTLDIPKVVSNKSVPEFIVIDLTCDVDDESDLSRSENASVNDCRIDCDSSEPSVETSLVPVGNNEIARRENQKLLSLSLSILLAALLQAMRCFAQFLEDIIVIPHR